MSAAPPHTIARELNDRERVVWSGRPRLTGIRFTWLDLILVAIGLNLLIGSTGFFVMSLSAGSMIGLLAIPFVIAGVYLTTGRFVYERYVRRRTDYALTDERILIVTATRVPTVRSIPLARLAEVGLIEHNDGWGTIRLGTQSALENLIARILPDLWSGSRDMGASSLMMIEDVRRVYAAVVTLQNQAASRR